MEAKLTDFLTLKLEDGQVNIYVGGEYFNQCKSLLLDVPTTEKECESIDSIDEAERKYSRGLVANKKHYQLTPEEEFWGHCSNLQAWVENDYDTRLLHRNLAFPLLKKLVKAGEKKAEFQFKEEILERTKIALEKGADSILLFFLEGGYYNILFEDPKEKKFLKEILSYLFQKVKIKENMFLKLKIAENLNTPHFILKKLSRDVFPFVRERVAHNQKAPFSIIRELAKDKDYKVRMAVARNPNTHPSVLKDLSKDKNVFIRESVARNPSTPFSILEELSIDKNNYVRRDVARNPNIPISLLEELSKDADSSVRIMVAMNPNTSLFLLEKLSEDKDYLVRCCANSNRI